MSTKELFESHALIYNIKELSKCYMKVDRAIEKYINAEIDVHMELMQAVQRIDHVPLDQEVSSSREEEIYRERFKTVICRLAAQTFPGTQPNIPDMTDEQALKYLADFHGCPRAFWQ